MAGPEQPKPSLLAEKAPNLEVGVGELSMKDAWWLDDLREAPDEQVTEKLLEWGNELAVEGSKDLRGITDPVEHQQVVAARYLFWGTFLRFNETDHSAHDTYVKAQRANQYLGLCGTFIGTQRFFYGQRINGKKIAASGPKGLFKSLQGSQKLVTALTTAGIDAVDTLNTAPSIGNSIARPFDTIRELDTSFREAGLSLQAVAGRNARLLSIDVSKYSIQDRLVAYRRNGIEDPPALTTKDLPAFFLDPPQIDRRFGRIYEISSTLRWLGSVQDLLKTYAGNTLLASEARSEVFAHMFLKHGNKTWLTKNVGSLVSQSVETNLLTVALGLPYNSSSVSKIAKQFPAAERKELVNHLLTDDSPESEKARIRIGGPTLRAYQTYREQKGQEQATEAEDV